MRKGFNAFYVGAALFGLAALIGLLFVGIGGAERYKYRDAVVTEGVVVGLLESRSSSSSSSDSSSPTYAPRIKWTDSTGETYEFLSDFYRSPSPRIGDTVVLEYLEGQPYTVREASFWARWLMIFIGGGIAAVFGSLAVVMAKLASAARPDWRAELSEPQLATDEPTGHADHDGGTPTTWDTYR